MEILLFKTGNSTDILESKTHLPLYSQINCKKSRICRLFFSVYNWTCRQILPRNIIRKKYSRISFRPRRTIRRLDSRHIQREIHYTSSRYIEGDRGAKNSTPRAVQYIAAARPTHSSPRVHNEGDARACWQKSASSPAKNITTRKKARTRSGQRLSLSLPLPLSFFLLARAHTLVPFFFRYAFCIQL